MFCSSIVDVVRDKNCALLELLVKSKFSLPDAKRGLLVAAENGYTDCVDVLLQAGIRQELEDSSCSAALSAAASAGHDDVVRQLASAVSRSCLSAQWRGSTALHKAVASGRGGCVAALVAAGANVNAVDSAGDTPLIVAAKHCRQSLASMKCLVGAGCDLQRVDAERRTALHYACYRAVGAELLLSAGAKTDIQVNDTNSFLCVTASTAVARLSHRNSVCPFVCPSLCPSVTRVDQSAAWKILVSGTVKLFHKFEGGHPERGR